jgi:ligand-binding sensor domain-containing protein
MKNTLITLLLFWVSFSAMSQVQIGEWRSHLPANNFSFIDELGSSVLAANSSGVLIYDRDEGSTQHLTKINALVDAGISCFACSEENNACVIGYENGNIDIVTLQKTVVNQPALKNNFIVGNKRINDILFLDTTAILATNIGLLQLDLRTFNINADRRYNVGEERLSIKTISEHNDSLFFGTQLGLFNSSIAGVFEESIFHQIDFPEDHDLIQQLVEIDEQLYAVYVVDSLFFGDTLYRYNSTGFEKSTFLAGDGIKRIHYRDSVITVAHSDRVAQYNLEFAQTANIFTYGDDGGMEPKRALLNSDDEILVADSRYGLVITTAENQFNSEVVGISSPSVSQITVLNQIGDIIYAFPGGSEATFNTPRMHVFKDNEWNSTIISSDQFSTMRNTNGCVLSGDKLYVSTARVGIAELSANNTIEALYDYTNSSLQDLEPTIPYDYVGITDMVSAKNGTIYALNYRVPKPLIIRKTNGEWDAIQFPDLPSPKTGDLLISDNGYLALNIIDVGVLIYNTQNTHNNTSDDEYRLLTTSPTSGNLPSGNVTCLAFDNDNELWIGTDAGIGVVYSVESVFNSSFDGAQKIIVSQDGFNGYLFETETVEAIAVDGANRKWVGTASSGLFLISDDGQEQIHNFTTQNSPLLNNKVTDLAIHPVSGEVFIASENGLISYRSNATTPEEALNEIGVFPNPVKPGYTGNIAFTDLTNDSYVRVTDQTGNLIYETTSFGGQAIWDGKNRSGQRAPSGVYLIFAATREGTGGQVGKIMILN